MKIKKIKKFITTYKMGKDLMMLKFKNKNFTAAKTQFQYMVSHRQIVRQNSLFSKKDLRYFIVYENDNEKNYGFVYYGSKNDDILMKLSICLFLG